MDKKSSPAFTMSSRLKQTIRTFEPGPLSYQQNIDMIKPSNPRTVIGKASRDTFKQKDGPAPGQYEPQQPSRNKSFSAVFSTYKQPLIKEYVRKLGPGSYNPEYDRVLKKNSCCKFNKSSRSYQRQSQVKIPDPLTYKPKIDSIYKHQPTTKFGHSQRQGPQKMKIFIPGPGQYNTQKIKTYRSQSAYKFAKQMRSNSKMNKQPGPLDYKIQSQFDANLRLNKGFKIRLNMQRNLHDKIPGPFSYNSQKKNLFKRAPAFSISKGDRMNLFSNTIQTPGPNFYNVIKEPKKRVSSAMITFSKRQSGKNKKNIPGPGYYEQALQCNNVGTGIKFTIPRSVMDKKQSAEKRPGPWSYNTIEGLKQNLKYGILGKSQRQHSSSRVNFPGPSDYQIKDKNISGIIIGKQKRGQDKIQKLPGPGSYQIPSTIGNVPCYYKSKNK